jgi:2-keto-3-deoxy-L-rhamnonate aldolase RhmA
VIVPHVDTVERAKQIAKAFRYPPIGHRSWGGPPAVFGFKAPGNAEAQAALNKAVLVVAMIESPQAVAQRRGDRRGRGHRCAADRHLGPDRRDWASRARSIIRASRGLRSVGAACRAHGKALGMGGVYDKENASRYIKGGARMVLSGADHVYLMAGAKARSECARAAV